MRETVGEAPSGQGGANMKAVGGWEGEAMSLTVGITIWGAS